MSDKSSMANALYNSCGVIIFGSGASVNDKSDWQKLLREVVDNTLKMDIPLLGICFGHQFIINHYGGKIHHLWSKEKKKGIRKVHFKPNELIEDSHFYNLIYSHKEGATSCPDNLKIIGSSDLVDIESVEHKTKAVWGFQTHIEASWSFTKRQGLTQKEYELSNKSGNKIMKAFFKKIRVIK
tara:strand:- start:510 stop:1055 length:546 start_codon:yes stop_codon:yes gene_type:complete